MEIKIRHSTKHDIEAIKAIIEQPSCYSGTLQFPYTDIEKLEKRFTNIPKNRFSIVALVNSLVIGQLSLEIFSNRRRSHAAQLGMIVSEEYQAKGIGSALLSEMLRFADDWLAVKRIELEVYTDNDAGIALYKKFGFDIEGTAKQYAFRDGEYVDVYMMARINS